MILIWLDPLNARVLVREIKSQLSSIDPVNAARYQSNAKKTEAKLDELVTEIEAELTGLQGREFIAFHDAYQYFENRFGVRAVGTITVSPEVMPGAKRLKELREKVKNSKATCVFFLSHNSNLGWLKLSQTAPTLGRAYWIHWGRAQAGGRSLSESDSANGQSTKRVSVIIDQQV